MQDTNLSRIVIPLTKKADRVGKSSDSVFSPVHVIFKNSGVCEWSASMGRLFQRSPNPVLHVDPQESKHATQKVLTDGSTLP